MIKKLSLSLAAFLALVVVSAPLVTAEEVTTFPDFIVQGDLSKEQLNYLGADSPEVRLSSIDAEYLLVEVFSMYCPICQREAPAVNKLYAQTLRHKSLRMIGVATGNTPFEVQFFRDEYKVPFPLFHDEQFVVNKGLGEVGTPYFVLVKNNGPDQLEAVYVHEGSVEDMGVLWDEIRAAAGIK